MFPPPPETVANKLSSLIRHRGGGEGVPVLVGLKLTLPSSIFQVFLAPAICLCTRPFTYCIFWDAGWNSGKDVSTVMCFQGQVIIPKPSIFVLGAWIMQNDELSST